MISEKKFISTDDSHSLCAHIVENDSPVWIVVTHGLGEHSGRHRYIHKLFAQYFNICLYDLRGHGESSGKRGYVESFEHFTNDLSTVLNYLKETYKMERFILLGHSLGGLITASYIQKLEKSDFYPEKVLLSAPASGAAGVLGAAIGTAPVKLMDSLAGFRFSIPIKGAIDLSKLSHDSRVYEAYISDPLCILKVHTKLFLELLSEAKKVFSKPLRAQCDLFCTVGTGDIVVDSRRTIDYFNTIEKNAKLLIVKDAYHEMHNEIQKYQEQYFDFLKESLMDSVHSN